MIILSSHDELKAAKEDIHKLKNNYPNLFDKLLHVINLTRALQFKYQFMGSLIMDENIAENTPNYVYGTVLRLYKNELQKLIDDIDSDVVKDFFTNHHHIGYAKISLLVLGNSPESLVGPSPIK